MKFRTLTLKQAEAKHPDCFLELKMRTTSDGIPQHEVLPVAECRLSVYGRTGRPPLLEMNPNAGLSTGLMRDSDSENRQLLPYIC